MPSRVIGELDKGIVIDRTRRWIRSMVIGLNLCPFAQRVFQANMIRYIVTVAQDEVALLHDLVGELDTLASSTLWSVETTLLIHPRALGTFHDFNDFLGVAERLVGDLRSEERRVGTG